MHNVFKIIFVTIILAFTSCRSLDIKVPKGNTILDEKPMTTMIGCAKIDITPPPGQSMGGYGGHLGSVAKGWWTRLFARSYFISNTSGEYIIIVNTDLWSVSSGLTDKVMYYLNDGSQPQFNVARENIIIGASHTHNSPGNFSTSFGYNVASSKLAGFDEELFEFLAQRIAYCIKQSILSAKSGKAYYTYSKVEGLTRNRSIQAFQRNPQDQQSTILQRVNNPRNYFEESVKCYTPSDTVFQAVDPYLYTLILKDEEERPSGVISFFSVHPTVLGFDTPLYSSDIFGIANLIVENYLKTINDSGGISSIANGAEGDVSAHWYKQNRQNTERIGERIAMTIIEHIKSENVLELGSKIVTKLEYRNIRNQRVEDRYGELDCNGTPILNTSDRPIIGAATPEGAEDGRTEHLSYDEECAYQEARQGHSCIGAHGNKIHYLPSYLMKNSAPKHLPVGLYSIGELSLITVPGEMTVALGERLRSRVNNPREQTLIFGLANEYMSYFTTPSEYFLQHYEGSSTMYGAATGAYLEEEVDRLIEYVQPYQNEYYNTQKYKVATRLFLDEAQKEITELDFQPEEEFEAIYEDYDSLLYTQKCVSWTDPKFDIKDKYSNQYLSILNPYIFVEQKVNDNWTLLSIERTFENGMLVTEPQSDMASSNFILYINCVEDKTNWEACWLPPSDFTTNRELRVVAKLTSGERIKGFSF